MCHGWIAFTKRYFLFILCSYFVVSKILFSHTPYPLDYFGSEAWNTSTGSWSTTCPVSFYVLLPTRSAVDLQGPLWTNRRVVFPSGRSSHHNRVNVVSSVLFAQSYNRYHFRIELFKESNGKEMFLPYEKPLQPSALTELMLVLGWQSVQSEIPTKSSYPRSWKPKKWRATDLDAILWSFQYASSWNSTVS